MLFTHTRIQPLWLLLSSLTLLAGQAQAAPQAPDWPRFNHQAVEQHVLPRYAALELAAQQLSESTQTLCAAPSASTLQQAQQHWRDAMGAWQGIQHVQFGPVQFLMRNFGLEFWPDRKNIGARQLREALTSEQPYDDGFFRLASVSLQGFPALERLLFADTTLQDMTQGRNCELTQAIAGHVANISKAIHTEWIDLAADDFSPEQDPEEAAELAVELMASLVEPIEAVRDSKLIKPMNGSADKARPKLLESHRSGHSLANISHNLAALNELYQGTDASVYQLLQQAEAGQLGDEINVTFKQLDQQLGAIEAPLKTALTQPEAHAQLQQVTRLLKQLSEQLDSAMQVLDIELGFNSRDGD